MSEGGNKRRIGPFELEGTLGVGGMGIVYKAKYLKTGQYVAVKVLAPDLMSDEKIAKRFEREMAILKKLKHPHIVRYYGGSSTGSQQFYAMELVKGGSLEELIIKKGPLDWEQVVDYSIAIAKALEHAHTAGIIHRDLKPANLLITPRGLKLTDFGIARDTRSTALTAAGKTLGTMAYMAPEQINGRHTINAKTDLYALGCVMFEMLTGRTVFVTDTPPEMLFKHMEEEPPSVREFNMEVPLWLDQLIDECLSKHPDDRPYDALALQVKLEEIKTKVAENQSFVGQTLAGSGVGATLKGNEELTRILNKGKRKKKKKKKQQPIYETAWFLGACLVGVIGLLVWGFWPQSEAEVFAKIQPIMRSEDPNDWYDAEYFIKDFLADYPEGTHVDQVTEWGEWIDMTRAEAQAERRASMNRDPASPAERSYMQARQYEKFGDRLTAMQKYQAMQSLFAGDADERAFVNLAKRQMDKIKQSIGSEDDPVEFVKKQMQEADDAFLAGNEILARSRWQSITTLYQDSPEYASLVNKARLRLLDPQAAMREEYEAASAPEEPL